MSYLCKILVKKENIKALGDDAVRKLAAEATEQFYPLAFESRTFADAGFWSESIINNVLYGEDDFRGIIIDLYEIKNSTNYKLLDHQLEFKQATCGGLASMIDDFVKTNGTYTSESVYLLQKICDILACKLTPEVGFYNCAYGDAVIDKALIDDIKSNPQNYAMVYFEHRI